MTAAISAPAALRPQHREVNPWLVAITVTLATFMEVLDTSIANVALPHIAGSLSATTDEATWVLTSYLVANAIVLPLSAWLSEMIGRKRFYMLCVTLFTASSFLCGLAPNLGMLVFFRVIQGIGGGGLQPSEQAILADTFPPKKRGMAFAVYGFAVVAAPAIGPTLGGYITDNVSWRWIFYINIPIGIISLLLTSRLVHDPPQFQAEQRRVRRRGFKVDYIGLGLIAIGLGCLQIVLDKGQRDDWFSSKFILWMFVVAVIGIIAAVIWEWKAKYPIVDLRLFKERNFAIASAILFMIGLVLFSSTVLLPLMLQTLFNYTALDAGLVLSPGALMIMAAMPIVGFLLQKVEPRWLIIFSLIVCSFGLYLMSGFTTQTDLRTFVIYRCVQAGAIGFLFVPVNTAMYAYIPAGKNNNASALVNLARNIGGSVGISLITTFLERRQQFHQSRLVEKLTPYNRHFQSTLSSVSSYFSAHTHGSGLQQAYGQIYRMVQQQAGMLAYVDCYYVLAFAFTLLIPFVFLLKPTRGHGGMAVH
ncbi:MAG TPA: DHA2 family efflux MFS transporter permease subunit [Tepidisphaeraceae bacterium]|nr:DHA2 family efflux MFS transporter permease subunit [Tepidisphaeraceae bacterium]